MSIHQHDFLPTSEQVRDLRSSRIIRAQLVDRFDLARNIVIWNVSKTGIGASTKGKLPEEGAEVIIKLLESSPIPGTVRWVDGDSFGIALADEIDLEFLSEMLKRKQAERQQVGSWEVDRLHKVLTPPVRETATLRKI